MKPLSLMRLMPLMPSQIVQIVSLKAARDCHAYAVRATVKAVAFSLLAAGIIVSATPIHAQTPPAPVVDKSIGATKPATTVTAPTPSPTPAPPPAQPSAVPTMRFVSIGDKPAVMYDAPSTRANKQFIILRNTPMEVLVKLDKWVKLRDADGSTNGWIESEFIGQRRHVMVNVDSTEVRSAALESAASAFKAQRGVLLEATGAATDGWLPVKHRDGQMGFVKLAHVFGH